MDFRELAQSALERGEPARALVLLLHGLRREPERDDALDLFLSIYTQQITQPGLESDLIRGLEFQDNRGAILRLVVDELREMDKPAMADAVEEEARSRDVEIAPVVVDEAEEEDESDDVEKDDEQAAPEPEPAVEEVPSESLNRSFDVGSEDGEDEKPARLASKTGANEQLELKQDKERRKAASSLKRRAFLLGVGTLGIVVAVSILVVGWQHARDAAQMRAIDAALASFDPASPENVLEQIDEALAPATSRRSAEFKERKRFVGAILALEYGDPPPVWEGDDESVSSWGLAAEALEAAYDEDWEEAVRFAHHLEHAHGETLPAFFTRGRICEARRDWECALARYSRAEQHFEEFLPARLGTIRVAAYRYDIQGWEREQDDLAELMPDHPYTDLRWNDPFAVETVAGVEGQEEIDEERSDLFIRKWQATSRAIENAGAQRWNDVVAACEDDDVGGTRHLPSLQVVCAQGAAGSVDAGGTDAFFEAASAEGKSIPEFYRYIQIMAPQLLHDLGRPDLAMKYTIPFDDEPLDTGDVEEITGIIEGYEEGRPAHFRPPGDSPDELQAEALLVRGRVLVGLGATQQARRNLAPLMTRPDTADRARFELVLSHLVEGNRQSARRVIEQIADERLKEAAEAHLAYLEGRHEEAHRFVWQKGDDVRALRIRALAFLADGRGREAMTALEAGGDGLDALSLIPVRQRVFARAGESSALAGLRDSMPEFEDATSIDYLVDLAGAAFWQRELESASQRLQKAGETAPDHPEVNWNLGLLDRVEGNERSARSHFRRAWRGDQDSTHLLVESGRVHLDYGRYEMARKVFLRASLRDRQNIDAIAGLGRAYMLGDRPRGQRDLQQLLGNYNSSPGDAPGRAEMNRWLAILYGARDGEEEAFQYLERARSIGGDRTSILAEIGTYYAAREEWEQSHEFYGMALRVDPTQPEVHLGLARAAGGMGDYDTADEHLDLLMRLVPMEEMRLEAEELRAEIEEARR